MINANPTFSSTTPSASNPSLKAFFVGNEKTNNIKPDISEMIKLATDPSATPVAQGQALAKMDSLSGGKAETFKLMSDQGNIAQSGISGDIALSARRTQKAEFISAEVSGWKGSEIKNNTTWHSESTFKENEYWSNMEMGYYDGGKRKLGNFQDLGCHATALLNAINTVAGTTATPRNARDYAGGFEGTNDSRNPKETDTRNVFLQAARKVEFIDIAVPGKTSRIKTENLFTTPGGSTKLDSALIQRIKDNVRAGNPVVIGIASTPGSFGGTSVRHSAVVTGIVVKDGKEQLLVRDNWKSDNGVAKLMTMDDFLRSYGRNASDTKLDYVWATRPRSS